MNQGKPSTWIWLLVLSSPVSSLATMVSWDTFRTTFPLFALIIPEHYRLFLEGFLNSYRDTGFLPKWLAPDERGMMPGTLLDGTIADSACKDMAPDLEVEFLQAMLETATKSDPLGINGRHGLAQYQRTGLPLYRPPRKC